MNKDQTTPHLGHWCLGALFVLLALAAGMISLSMNIAFGLKTSVFAALVFALSDCAMIMLPMVSSVLGRWDLRRRIAWGVAVMISVTAALSSLLEGEAQRLKDSQAAAHLAGDARTSIDRAKQELATMKEPLSVAVLRSLVDDARASANREAGRGGCGPRCEAARGEAAQLVARLGMAQRREALQAQLADAKTAAETNPETALGASDTLAALTGGDKTWIATLTSIAVSIAMLIILEHARSIGASVTRSLRRQHRPPRDLSELAGGRSPPRANRRCPAGRPGSECVWKRSAIRSTASSKPRPR
jgi:hypothetical protein